MTSQGACEGRLTSILGNVLSVQLYRATDALSVLLLEADEYFDPLPNIFMYFFTQLIVIRARDFTSQTY